MSDPTKDIAAGLIKGIIFDVVLKAAISRAIAYLPFLAWPIVNPLFTFFMSKLGSLIFTELKRNVSFAIIDYRTEKERAAYEAAAERLKNEFRQPEIDPASIEKAKQAMRDSLAELIRFRP